MLLRNLALIFSLLCSVAYGQTSGGGTFTNHQTSYTYNGGSACYPYQVAASSSASSATCTNGVFTFPVGSGSGGGGGSGTVTTSSIYQMAYYPANGNTVQGAATVYTNGSNVGIGATPTTPLYVLNGTTASPSLGTETGLLLDSSTSTNWLTFSEAANQEEGVEWDTGTNDMAHFIHVGNGNYFYWKDNSGFMTFDAGALSLNNASVGSNMLNVYGNAEVGQGYFATTAPTNGLIVQGNIGIGTSLSVNSLDISKNMSVGTAFAGYYAAPTNGTIIQGDVGIGTYFAGSAQLYVMSGTVGIGTWVPSDQLEIEGGNVGIGTWTVPDGGINNTIHWGNVGIGTSKVGGTGEGALTVMNGNVGIGTWVTPQTLTINGPILLNGASGNTGLGTQSPTGTLEAEGGNVGLGTWVQPEVLAVGGGIAMNGNLAGGVTGNVGISTTQVTTTTCDSSCNTAKQRCLFGLTVPLTGLEPCSASITGDCICLPAT